MADDQRNVDDDNEMPEYPSAPFVWQPYLHESAGALAWLEAEPDSPSEHVSSFILKICPFVLSETDINELMVPPSTQQNWREWLHHRRNSPGLRWFNSRYLQHVKRSIQPLTQDTTIWQLPPSTLRALCLPEATLEDLSAAVDAGTDLPLQRVANILLVLRALTNLSESAAAIPTKDQLHTDLICAFV